MSKARTLAGTVSDGAVLADGTVGYAEVSGAPTAPTGTVVGTTDTQTLTTKTINIANNTLTGVQPTLVSGTSIKTINGGSILGSGDLALSSGLNLVQTITASGSTVVVNGFSSAYDNYKLLIRDVFPSADGRNFELKFYIGGTLISADYQYGYVNVNSSSANSNIGSASNDTIRLANSMDQTTFNRSNNYEITIYGVNGSGFKSIVYNGTYHFSNTTYSINGAGTQTVTSGALTGLEIAFPGSSFGGGTFQLYGFAKA